jgi:hypothetical protein
LLTEGGIRRSRLKTSQLQLIINTKKNYNIVNRRTLVLAGVPENLKLLFSRSSHAGQLVWMRSMVVVFKVLKDNAADVAKLFILFWVINTQFTVFIYFA